MNGTVIFDWDGTLHNTKKLYAHAFRKAYSWLVEEGYAKPREYTEDEVSIYLGMNAPDMWNAFMPELPDDIWKHASSIIGGEMASSVANGKAVLFNGVPELLDRLKNEGYKLVFLSNCKHAYMEAHRQAFKLDQWFDGFYCCEDYSFAPKEEIFKDIKKIYEGPYVMVGDRFSDQKVSIAHKFPFIGCSYGYGKENEFENPDVIADSVEDIGRCIIEQKLLICRLP